MYSLVSHQMFKYNFQNHLTIFICNIYRTQKLHKTKPNNFLVRAKVKIRMGKKRNYLEQVINTNSKQNSYRCNSQGFAGVVVS